MLVLVYFRIRYKKHTTQIKYGLVVLGAFFMIYLIRALVNYQTILDSTNQVVQDMQTTKQHTDFINNFLHPYLESEYAPYFLAHENNQLFAWERVITINMQDHSLNPDLTTTSGDLRDSPQDSELLSEPSPATQWKRYLSEIIYPPHP